MLDRIFEILGTIWGYISLRRRFHIGALMVVTVLSGLFEIASISAIIPFLAILVTPEKVLEYEFFKGISNVFGTHSREDLVLLLTGIFLGAILMSAVLRYILLWLNVRTSHAIGADFEREVYRRNVYQPYEEHVKRNVSTVTACVLKTGAVTAIILSVLHIVHGGIIALFIVGSILIVDPYLSLGIFLVIGVVYLSVMTFTRLKLLRNGEMIARNTNIMLRWIQESIGGIRDIILEGRQRQYCDYFGDVSYKIKRAAGSNLLIGQAPRLIVEPVGIIVIGGVACFIALTGDFAAHLPFFGALALAAQRLLPTVQQMYAGWSAINSSIAQVDDVFEILRKPVPDEYLTKVSQPLAFERALKFDDVGFVYAGTQKSVLDGISFEIGKGQCIGIIGKSGGGKSTLLDLTLGLLTPTQGSICVDGFEMLGDIRQRWQRTVAHVPQDIYLNDATVLENIAFGVHPDQVDMDLVKDAVERAQLGDVIAELPDGLNSLVGERGKQLSGGQRQRIGIARALYKQAPVMIFDEATSALDMKTEQKVIHEIMKMASHVTLIIVTHRLPTLAHCDVIHMIDKGRVVASGTYDVISGVYDVPRLPEGNEGDLAEAGQESCVAAG